MIKGIKIQYIILGCVGALLAIALAFNLEFLGVPAFGVLIVCGSVDYVV